MVMHQEVLCENRCDKSASPSIRKKESDALKAHVVKTSVVVLCSASKASCVQCATRLQYTKKTNGCALLVIDHPRIGRIFIRPMYLGRLSTSRTQRSVV